jgi:adenylate cyclase class IV
MKKEIEIKIKIDKNIYTKLKDNRESIFERTFGFFSKDSVEKGIFPRIKEIHQGKHYRAILGVKKKYTSDTNYFQRQEEEIEIRYKDLQRTVNIFKMMGYDNIRVFDKERTQWFENNIEVSLDRLSLGYFIEFEGEKKDIEKIIKKYKLEKNERIAGAYLKIANEQNIENPILIDLDIKI